MSASSQRISSLASSQESSPKVEFVSHSLCTQWNPSHKRSHEVLHPHGQIVYCISNLTLWSRWTQMSPTVAHRSVNITACTSWTHISPSPASASAVARVLLLLPFARWKWDKNLAQGACGWRWRRRRGRRKYLPLNFISPTETYTRSLGGPKVQVNLEFSSCYYYDFIKCQIALRSSPPPGPSALSVSKAKGKMSGRSEEREETLLGLFSSGVKLTRDLFKCFECSDKQIKYTWLWRDERSLMKPLPRQPGAKNICPFVPSFNVTWSMSNGSNHNST